MDMDEFRMNRMRRRFARNFDPSRRLFAAAPGSGLQES
jgi:hypothetical protein